MSDRRLSDRLSVGVLTRVFPPELVDGVVAQAGRTEVRQRLLPARLVVYYVLAMALFADASYEEVMRQLVQGLAWASGWERVWEVPTKAAISKARARLGPGPLELLFGTVAGPLAVPSTRGAFYRGLRLMSLDATCLDVADTPQNDAAPRCRLITTILDPHAAPAPELAALYRERWEIQGALDELKAHQRGPRVVLRSKHPDGSTRKPMATSAPTTRYAASCSTRRSGPSSNLRPLRVQHGPVVQHGSVVDTAPSARPCRSTRPRRTPGHALPAGIPREP